MELDYQRPVSSVLVSLTSNSGQLTWTARTPGVVLCAQEPLAQGHCGLAQDPRKLVGRPGGNLSKVGQIVRTENPQNRPNFAG